MTSNNSAKNRRCTCLVHVFAEAKLSLQNKKLGSLKNFLSKPKVWIRNLVKELDQTNLLRKLKGI